MEAFLATVVFHLDDDPRATAARVAPQIDAVDYVRLNMEATA
jgi:hypothetical protein